jgi:inositol 1,4,5-triphosphate receptor type 1/inositol 1,4,5-triphosphate receptor type 3
MVAMLGVLFQYVFSIVGFNNYVDDIYPEKPEDPCHSLLSCMITLMTSGVIGTSMSEWDPLKFLYDTVYFVFFGLLFTNIIAGIMTDTFAGIVLA